MYSFSAATELQPVKFKASRRRMMCVLSCGCAISIVLLGPASVMPLAAVTRIRMLRLWSCMLGGQKSARDGSPTAKCRHDFARIQEHALFQQSFCGLTCVQAGEGGAAAKLESAEGGGLVCQAGTSASVSSHPAGDSVISYVLS